MFLIETIQEKTHTELALFSRDENGKKQVTKVRDFKPYFYVNSEEVVPDDYRIVLVETGHKSLDGKSVKKIVIRKSSDMIAVRSMFETHYEADINFAQRYIIDIVGEADIYDLHTLSLDIETDTDGNKFPNIATADQPVISCAFCDNMGNKKELIYKSPESTEEIEKADYITVYDTEEALLSGIVAYIKNNDPDVITGWNVINFDLIYLINRMQRLDIDYRAMSPMNMVFANEDTRHKNKYDINIRGRIIIDAMAAYMHFRKMSNQGRAESYSLEFTGQSVLGVGKVVHEENFHDMWVKKPNKLIEYNLRDAELVTNILEKLEIIQFFNYIRSKSYAQLSQIYHTTALVDGYLLRRGHNKFVFPSKSKQISDKYGGAHVFPPVPGLYDNVLALDLKSLYPNIIKTFNVSYETFNPNGEIKLEEGIAFDRGIGLVSGIMRELEKERKIYKKKMWKADQEGHESERKLNHYRQYAVKVLMNSFYGYLGYPGSRLYKRECAEAITKWGQLIIFWTKDVLEKAGYEIVYGDTDSVYVKSKTKGLFNLLKEGAMLIKLINESYFEFTKKYGSDDCTLEMEFEKLFKKVLFVGKRGSTEGAKKKYAYILLWEDNKKVDNSVKFTGFETVRSDTPRVARDTQTKVLEMILNGVQREEIVAMLQKLDKDIRTGVIPVENIAFPKGISKDMGEYGKTTTDVYNTEKTIGLPPVIKGARYANKYLGKRFAEGNKPKWIYIKKVPPGYPDTEVLTFDSETLPKGFIVNYDIMIEKLLKSKLEEIFLASGFGEFPRIDMRQTTL